MYYPSFLKQGSVNFPPAIPTSLQLVINMTLSEDRKKDKKLVKGVSGEKRL